MQTFFENNILTAAKKYSIRIFIDALDECGEEVAMGLISSLEQLTATADSCGAFLSICFSCRHYPILNLDSGMDICVEDENARDIQNYIWGKMEIQVPQKQELEEIRDEILERAKGSFQWTILVIPRVLAWTRKGKSSASIRQEIRKIPSTLEQLYKDLLSGISHDDRFHAFCLMEWICYALRPLSLRQLRYASLMTPQSDFKSVYQIESSDEYADSDDDMRRRVIDLSAGLAETTERSTVQFIHASVKDFMQENGLEFLRGPKASVKIGDCHQELLRSSLKFLSLAPEVSRGHELFRRGFITFGDYCTEYWPEHAEIAECNGKNLADLVTLLLRPYDAYSLKTSGERKNSWRVANITGYIDQESQPSNLFSAWLNMVRGPRYILSKYAKEKTTLLHVVSRHNLLSAGIAYFDHHGDHDFTLEHFDTSLSITINRGYSEMASLLFSHTKLRDKEALEIVNKALMKASRGGREEIVRLLLELGADANYTNLRCHDNSPLGIACKMGQQSSIAIRRLLLDYGADVNHSNKQGNSVLHIACPAKEKTNTDIIRLLLGRGADVQKLNDLGETVLMRECSKSRANLAVVDLLINSGINVNAMNAFGKTALFYAINCADERTEIVEHLLLHGAAITMTDNLGNTPLSFAATCGRKQCVDVLLAHGADAHESEYSRRNALISAFQGEETASLEMLIERVVGDDDHSKREKIDSLLERASEEGFYFGSSVVIPGLRHSALRSSEPP